MQLRVGQTLELSELWSNFDSHIYLPSPCLNPLMWLKCVKFTGVYFDLIN